LAITRERAHEIAAAELRRVGPDFVAFDDELVLLEDATIERDFGWVFFYDSKRHRETRNDEYGLLGNAPFIVDRADGSVHYTGTGRRIDFYINEYKRSRR
jgi:Immunity protein 35